MDKNARIDELLKMVSQLPNDPFPLYALGLEYLSSDNFDQAVHFFLQTEAKFPDYLPTFYQLGNLFFKMDDVEKAKITFKKGIALAEKQTNRKTKAELEEALFLLD